MGAICSSAPQTVTSESVGYDGEETALSKKEPVKKEPQLTVHIVGARGLRDADWMPGGGKSDCFVELQVGKNVLHRTEVIKDTLEPVWQEVVEVNTWKDQPLEFHLFDADLGETKDLLGKVVLPSYDFAEQGFNGEVQIMESDTEVRAFLRLKVKVRGKELPQGPAVNVEIECSKESFKSWGLELDTQDSEMLYVTEVKPGPFGSFNEKKPPEAHLIKGDFIVAVNDVSGSPAALLNQFKVSTKVKLDVVRSVETACILEHSDAKVPLGFSFPRKPAGDHLVVLEVEDETMVGKKSTLKSKDSKGRDRKKLKANANSDLTAPTQMKMVPQEQRIKAGDRIVAVGGVRGKATTLLEKVQQVGSFQVTVVRPTKEETKNLWGF